MTKQHLEKLYEWIWHYKLAPAQRKTLIVIMIDTCSNAEAAKYLGIKEKAVVWTLAEIFRKTGTRNRLKLYQKAIGYVYGALDINGNPLAQIVDLKDVMPPQNTTE